MQILSALDAVSPAIARTKLVLFTPFRKGRTWKLAATGYLAFLSLVFFPVPLAGLFFLPLALHAHHAWVAPAVVLGITLLTVLMLALFYWCSRLQLAFFDIVLNRGEFVAPAWRKYGPQAWRWTGFKVAFGTVLTLLIAAPFVSFLNRVFSDMQRLSGNQQPPPELFVGFLAFEFGIFFGFAGLYLAGSLLNDFIVPSMALEDAPLREALRRMLGLMRREPGQFCAYVLVKIGLGLAGYMAQSLIFYIVVFVFVLVLGAVCFVGYLALHAMGVGYVVMTVLAAVVVLPAYCVLIFYVALLLVGTVLTFLQAYALYFLGGRYPLLGEALERSTPPAAIMAAPEYEVPYDGPPSSE